MVFVFDGKVIGNFDAKPGFFVARVGFNVG